MTMGGYLEDTDRYEGFYISSFEWNMAIGINVTMLFFNFSLDAIAFGVEGAQNGSGGYFTWDITASALSGAKVLWSKTTYTTADAKSLEKPVEAYGVNFFPNEEGVTFYNPDGTKTAADGSQGNAAGWKFRDNLSAYSWDGGLYQGEIPLNADLATARLDGASVAFQTDSSKIQIFFDGRISVKNNSTGKIDSYRHLSGDVRESAVPAADPGDRDPRGGLRGRGRLPQHGLRRYAARHELRPYSHRLGSGEQDHQRHRADDLRTEGEMHESAVRHLPLACQRPAGARVRQQSLQGRQAERLLLQGGPLGGGAGNHQRHHGDRLQPEGSGDQSAVRDLPVPGARPDCRLTPDRAAPNEPGASNQPQKRSGRNLPAGSCEEKARR